jgi:hypothetical protein
LFGFMLGTDIGEVGEKEIQPVILSRFEKRPGYYRLFSPQLEYEFVPIENLCSVSIRSFSEPGVSFSPFSSSALTSETASTSDETRATVRSIAMRPPNERGDPAAALVAHWTIQSLRCGFKSLVMLHCSSTSGRPSRNPT